MIRLLVIVYGVIPVVVLGLLALAPLSGGLLILFEQPAEGAMYIAWSAAGLIGARTMLQVVGGTVTRNTVPGLLAGIAAAAPLVYGTLRGFDPPGSWLPLYFTASPVVVALGYVLDLVLSEPPDNARSGSFL